LLVLVLIAMQFNPNAGWGLTVIVVMWLPGGVLGGLLGAILQARGLRRGWLLGGCAGGLIVYVFPLLWSLFLIH
jgi:hypothetical protein